MARETEQTGETRVLIQILTTYAIQPSLIILPINSNFLLKLNVSSV